MTAPASLDEVLAVLRARRQKVQAQAGMAFVGVVGSLARGDARPESDVDVVFDVTGPFSYLGLGAVLCELSEIFGRPVDLVDRAMMRPERWAYMARDLVPLA